MRRLVSLILAIAASVVPCSAAAAADGGAGGEGTKISVDETLRATRTLGATLVAAELEVRARQAVLDALPEMREKAAGAWGRVGAGHRSEFLSPYEDLKVVYNDALELAKRRADGAREQGASAVIAMPEDTARMRKTWRSELVQRKALETTQSRALADTLRQEAGHGLRSKFVVSRLSGWAKAKYAVAETQAKLDLLGE